MRFPLVLLSAALVGLVAGYASFQDRAPPALRGSATSGGAHEARQVGTDADPTGADSERAITLRDVLASKEGRLRREHDLYLAIQRVEARDFELVNGEPAGLVVIAKELENIDYQFRRALVARFIERWLELDKSAALEWFKRDAGSLKDVTALRDWALRALARKAPEEMFALGLKRDKYGDSVPALLVEELAQENPLLARKFIERFTDKADRAAAESGWCMALAMTDPLAAADLMATLTDKSQVTYIWSRAVSTSGRGGPGGLRSMAAKATEPWMLGKVVLAMTEQDPEEAARLASDVLAKARPVDLENASYEYLGAVADALVRRDPLRAAQWANALTGDARAVALADVAKVWATRDPAAALAWLADHPSQFSGDADKPLPLRRDARMYAVYAWLQRDEAAARDWAATLPAGELRDGAQACLILRLAQSGRAAEAARIGEEFSAEPTGWLARRVAEQFAYTDPLAAANWAAGLPPSQAQEHAVAATVKRWTERDPEAAARWLEQFPPGAVRDRAIATYARITASSDVRAAAQWVLQVEDEWQRTRAAREVFQAWNSRDAAAARAWLSAVPGLDEEVRRQTLFDK